MNMAYIDNLFRRVIQQIGDPRRRNTPLESDMWYEPAEAPMMGKAFAALYFFGSLRTTRMTLGKFSNVVVGMNRIRLDYPKLSFNCIAYQLEPERESLGGVRLDYQSPPGA